MMNVCVRSVFVTTNENAREKNGKKKSFRMMHARNAPHQGKQKEEKTAKTTNNCSQSSHLVKLLQRLQVATELVGVQNPVLQARNIET
jgi:hypothetical protein